MADQIEVKHTGGIGWFFFALIPGALAGALLMYLAFFTGIIDWQKAQRIEGRMDNRVGVNGALVAPVQLIMRGTGCLKVSRSYLDAANDDYDPGSNLTLYVTNNCSHELPGYQWEVNVNSIAPDGTVINSNHDIQAAEIDSGQTFEVTEKVPNDSRTVKIVVWAKSDQ